MHLTHSPSGQPSVHPRASGIRSRIIMVAGLVAGAAAMTVGHVESDVPVSAKPSEDISGDLPVGPSAVRGEPLMVQPVSLTTATTEVVKGKVMDLADLPQNVDLRGATIRLKTDVERGPVFEFTVSEDGASLHIRQDVKTDKGGTIYLQLVKSVAPVVGTQHHAARWEKFSWDGVNFKILGKANGNTNESEKSPKELAGMSYILSKLGHCPFPVSVPSHLAWTGTTTEGWVYREGMEPK
jgi:hypothetical protein